ncbi:MAG: hypothetical protein AAFQ90_11025 [Pseudomonadota bacterium]
MTTGLRRALLAFFLGFWALTSPALAAWHKAESERFVIYSDSRPEDLRKWAEMLERYHAAIELETRFRLPAPSPSNRLTIYMVGSMDDLRQVYGNRRSAVGGFYIPRANGSVTFVPNVSKRNRDRTAGLGTRRRKGVSNASLPREMRIVLHEYAHHFLISSSRAAMPRWLSEGSAEYFSSARFNSDGSVDIGLPNNARAWEISQAAPVSVRELLDYQLYRKNVGSRYDAFYGRSWLLYHYLRFNPARKGQLQQYWGAVATGTDSLEAGEAIFGDLDQLEKELRKYGRERSMAGMRMPSEAIAVGSISTSKLSDSHSAMMDVIINSKRGVSRKAALELLPTAQKIVSRYPEDAEAFAALAEAEYDAGNDDAAIAAADRAIALNPETKNAYVQKGYALFRKARNIEDPAERDKAYVAAMKPFEALNALEADHTQPLIYYYRSFIERGAKLPDDAKFALERATQLAPFDQELAMETASMLALGGESNISRILLNPVASDPHGGREAKIAQAMLNYLDRVPDAKTVDLSQIARAYDEAREKARAEAEDDDSSGDADDGSEG